jgi:hypothetical protein
MIGAMPSQCPYAPSALVNRRNSFDMQQDRQRAVRATRGEQVARQAVGKYLRVVVEQGQGVPECLHARRVGGPQFRTVQVVPVIEECLPEVLGSPQQDAAGADPVACRQRGLALLGQVRREAGPGPVPAVAVTGSDLLGDGQALAHVGHARIGLADTALELALPRHATPRCHAYSRPISSTIPAGSSN